MSTDIHKWDTFQSHPERFEKKMSLKQFGNQQLSKNSVSLTSKKEHGGYLVINALSTVLGLWHDWGKPYIHKPPYESKVAFTRPAIQPVHFEVDSWRLNKARKTTLSASSETTSPYFRIRQGCRSKAQNLCTTSRHSVIQEDTTNIPVKSTKGGLDEAGLRKDFGKHQNILPIVFYDANTIKASAGQLLQNCKNHAIGPRGDCKPVVLSTTGKSESKRVHVNFLKNSRNYESDPSHCETALGLLPILSCVLQVHQFSELLLSQAIAIKTLISYAITVRFFLVGIILQQCEVFRRGEIKVNIAKNNCENIDKGRLKPKKVSTNLSTASTPIVSGSMAYRGEMNPREAVFDLGAGEEEEQEYMEDEEIDDGEQAIIPAVPDFQRITEGDDWRLAEDHFWNDGMGDGEQHHQVDPNLQVDNGQQRSQLLDEFLSQVICDPDEIAAIANAATDPVAPPDQEEINLFLNEEWVDDLLLVNLNAANAA